MSNRKLYIEFTRPKAGLMPMSKAIRFVEGTDYSHVRVSWINTTGRKVVYEASSFGVKFIGTIAQSQKEVIVVDSFEIDLSKEEYRTLIDVCMEYAGVSYAWAQLVGILFTYIPGVNKNYFSDGRSSQVCSELIGTLLERVKNIDIKEDLDIAGPRLINETLSKLNRPDIRKGFIAS